MNIKIDERHIDGITVLDIVGKLTIDEAAQQLRDKINSLIAQKETRIVLNLQHVPYIDSGGLGELIASFRIGHTGRRDDEAAKRERAESRSALDYEAGDGFRVVRFGGRSCLELREGRSGGARMKAVARLLVLSVFP